MAGADMIEDRQARLARTVQAHLGRASRFADGATRNWTLFFFFRVLPQAELDARRLLAALAATAPEERNNVAARLMAAVDRSASAEGAAGPTPARAFFDWLKLLTGPGSTAIDNASDSVAGSETPAPDTGAGGWLQGLFDDLTDALRAAAETRSRQDEPLEPTDELGRILSGLSGARSDPERFRNLFLKFGRTAGEAGLAALSGGLLNVCLYELLRQMAPALLKAPQAPPLSIMRSEAAEDEILQASDGEDKQWDPVPINYAFTHSGLAALGLSEVTLESFPDAFKQGMAARAERLGDTGPSAPENWHGALGLKSVHGYFTGGFLVGGRRLPVKESLWQRLRDDVQAFNDRSGGHGELLRQRLGMLFALIGLEVLHIELGEDPHEVDEEGYVKRYPYRLEHFGFRDGISQPFVNMKLRDTPPGGGTPRRDRTWAPVAPGEIYLDAPDEDGNIHQQPIHPLLRRGSTFLVFRKLEQDVAGFRSFLAKHRPGDADAQTKLAAQIVGRWPNGTPLVRSPDAPLELGRGSDEVINDFLYAADDPHGRRCPLGAHVRRSNPRDIGGTDDVRRHRILRRGIAYGGPLLPHSVPDDGKKRGLLFIAANSRIDLQFEVIQSNWLNKGEFLGQAGLGRCPLTGANLGGPSDSFLESGAAAPLTNLPRFVITRGGDYFFAPGMEALRAIAQGSKFEVDRAALPFKGNSLGDAATPLLFGEQRLAGYLPRILGGKPSVIRLRMPASDSQHGIGEELARAPVAFVGQLADVKQVLSIRLDSRQQIINSVLQYTNASRRIGRGADMLVGTEPGIDAAMAERRDRMQKILDAAWKAVGPGPAIYPRLQAIVQRSIEAALRRTGPSRRIDLVGDLASAAVYGVLREVFGTPGPDWLTELAIALPFSHQHVSQVDPDWLAGLAGSKPEDVGAATLQIWSILLAVDIVANYGQQRELMALSSQAGSELMLHLDQLVAAARERQAPATANLTAAFVALEKQFTALFGYGPAEYYTEVRMLLLELVSSAMGVIPGTFGVLMGTVLDHGIRLGDLMPILLAAPLFSKPGATPAAADGLRQLIYETWRVNPSLKLLARHCRQDDVLPSGGKLKAGDWVISIIPAANLDPRAFPEPRRFSLAPFLPGPERKLDNYLMFGAIGGGRECWGRDQLALLTLKECIKAAARLDGLSKVAGTRGEARKVAEVVVGLPARFSRVRPPW